MDNVQVFAEGDLKLEDVDAASGNLIKRKFNVEATDGQLDIGFLDAGGSTSSWYISRIGVDDDESAPVPQINGVIVQVIF